MRRSQSVRVMLAVANRDPEIFADPDAFDLRRADAKEHLAVGFGPRFCLSTSLARMTAVAAFRTLAERCPDLRLVDDGVLAHRGSGLRRIPELRYDWALRGPPSRRAGSTPRCPCPCT
jgi:cytochrome P450